LFFQQINDIVQNQQAVYLSDSKTNQIIITNKNFEVRGLIRQQGKGPGEFIRVRDLMANDSFLYAIDEGDQHIQQYSVYGEFLREFQPNISLLSTTTNWAVDPNGYMYVVDLMSQNPLIKLDPSGKLEKKIGHALPPDPNPYKNQRHVLIDEQNQIITVSKCHPLIEVFDTSGVLLFRQDLSNQPFLQQTLAYQQTEYEQSGHDPGLAISLFADAKYDEQKLFLLYYDMAHIGHKKISTANKLLVLSKKPQRFLPEKILVLSSQIEGEKWQNYKTFSIDGNLLYAYDTRSASLQVFKWK